MLHLPQGYNSRDCHCRDYHLEVLQDKDSRKAKADNLKSKYAFATTDQEALIMCLLYANSWVRFSQRSKKVRHHLCHIRRGIPIRWDLKKGMLAWMCRVHWEGWGHCVPTRTKRNGCSAKGEERKNQQAGQRNLNTDFRTQTKEGSVTYDGFQIWESWGRGEGNLG